MGKVFYDFFGTKEKKYDIIEKTRLREDGMEEKNYHVCCFTGHRNLPIDSMRAIYSRLGRAVRYAYDRGVREFRVGGALGFDTLAALSVQSL